MLETTNSPLVAGQTLMKVGVARTRVRIVRATIIDGARVEVGAELEVDKALAAVLMQGGKAEKAPPVTHQPERKPPVATSDKEKSNAKQ